MTMATDLSLDDYNINVTERAHGLLDKYSQTHASVSKSRLSSPFKTMKDVFMTAAYLGAQAGNPRPLEGKRVSPFKGSVLNPEEQLYLQALAIGHLESVEALADPQQVVRVAEEFANAGMLRLQEIADEGGEDALWNLVNFFLGELSSSAGGGSGGAEKKKSERA